MTEYRLLLTRRSVHELSVRSQFFRPLSSCPLDCQRLQESLNVLLSPISDRRYSFWCAYQRIEPMRYSTHIDHACNEISRVQRLPSDRLLVHSVRGQHLLERITAHANKSAGGTFGEYIDAYQLELRNAREAWPADLKDNRESIDFMITHGLHLHS